MTAAQPRRPSCRLRAGAGGIGLACVAVLLGSAARAASQETSPVRPYQGIGHSTPLGGTALAPLTPVFPPDAKVLGIDFASAYCETRNKTPGQPIYKGNVLLRLDARAGVNDIKALLFLPLTTSYQDPENPQAQTDAFASQPVRLWVAPGEQIVGLASSVPTQYYDTQCTYTVIGRFY